MTTDFTSDKPKIAQNSVLKLSSILEKLRNRYESEYENTALSKNQLDCSSSQRYIVKFYILNFNNLITRDFRDTHVVNALLYLTPR